MENISLVLEDSGRRGVAWEQKGCHGLASEGGLPARAPLCLIPGCGGQRPGLRACTPEVAYFRGGPAGRGWGGAGCITALAPASLLLPSGLGWGKGWGSLQAVQLPRSGAEGPPGSQILCCPLPTRGVPVLPGVCIPRPCPERRAEGPGKGGRRSGRRAGESGCGSGVAAA